MKYCYDGRNNSVKLTEGVNTVLIKCDDVITITFKEPDVGDMTAYHATVVAMNCHSMYIDTVDGDICGWVEFSNIKNIQLIGPGQTNKQSESVDMVNHPKHYKSESGMEVIDVIKAFTADLKGYQATDTGNIIKYILRWPHKNGLEDLKKARWYLDDLINTIENPNAMVHRRLNSLIVHKRLNSLECPVCGKDLAPLEPYDEDGKYKYWCDTCNIDICIKDNEEKENEK